MFGDLRFARNIGQMRVSPPGCFARNIKNAGGQSIGLFKAVSLLISKGQTQNSSSSKNGGSITRSANSPKP
ncbi:MAG: hypothetical protein MPK62_10445, partial [Alphaproteobacteria bacterium]|nr:hypothetical protein [Alphaproteobacteria bacterium]